jgi:hypothetical protein
LGACLGCILYCYWCDGLLQPETIEDLPEFKELVQSSKKSGLAIVCLTANLCVVCDFVVCVCFSFSEVRVKRIGSVYKFKVRCATKLRTLTVRDFQRAQKVRKAIPRGVFCFLCV